MVPALTPSPPPSGTAPPGSKTLDVGRWQVVVAGGHAVLPEGMTHLPDLAFDGRTSLVSVAFPSSLVSIGSGAFYCCSSLVAIDLPAGLTYIGGGAFWGCSALTSVTFPAGLTSIGGLAFALCSSLTHVTVPDTATVGDEAFEPETTVLRLPPKRMRDLQRWYEAVDGALAYKRCRPLLYGWLERAQTRLGSYGPDGAARQRDREEFEGDFAHLALHAD